MRRKLETVPSPPAPQIEQAIAGVQIEHGQGELNLASRILCPCAG
jgi:hypothetical protein